MLPAAAQLLPLVLQRQELLQPRPEHRKALAQLRHERLAGELQFMGTMRHVERRVRQPVACLCAIPPSF